jgi:hypothetical protein
MLDPRRGECEQFRRSRQGIVKLLKVVIAQ